MAVTFQVEGDPVPQPRPRISTASGFGRAYVPATHPVHEFRHRLQLAAIDAGLEKTHGAVEVVIDCVFARPRSHSTKRGLKPTAPRLPRPDVDNIAKAVLDAIGPILGDDTQVRRLVIEKTYGPQARTTVRVT